MEQSWSLNHSGAWVQGSGTAWAEAFAWSNQEYSASGDYSRGLDGGSLSGTWSQSGSRDEWWQMREDASRSASASGWTVTASGSAQASGGDTWDYAGDGAYSSDFSTSSGGYDGTQYRTSSRAESQAEESGGSRWSFDVTSDWSRNASGS